MHQKGFASRRKPRSTSTVIYTDATEVSILSDNRSIFRLANSYVDFVLIEDSITGVRLDKFKYNTASKYFINSSRCLWEIAVRRQTTPNPNQLYTFIDKYYIKPNHKYFIKPSVTPILNSDGSRSFTFRWENIPYNYLDPRKTCVVTLIAKLEPDAKHVEFSLSILANHPISSLDTDVCVSGVGMPSLMIRKSGSESYQDQDFLSVPVLEGQTILNPIKRLTPARFIEESIQYNENATKTLFGGSSNGVSPYINSNRASFGSPGYMNIPLLIFGNKQDKEGFLYYALDPDGLHAKNFQFYSDSNSLYIKSYDISDHEIDPFGMGGKDSSASLINDSVSALPVARIGDPDAELPIPRVGDPDAESQAFIAPSSTYGNQINRIGWTIRIRPFISPTIWTDWYGSSIYKEEVVPELENLNVVGRSFYSKYLSGELDLRDSEVPFINVVFGHLSGSASDVLSGSLYFQNLYKDSISPTPESIPKVINHIQPVTLNSGPIPLSTTGILSNYFGWETWANQPLGTSTGITPFKSPDFNGLNSTYSSTVSQMLGNGQAPVLFLSMPHIISSGSQWTIANDGMDLVTKSIYNKDSTITDSDYRYYANTYGNNGGVTSGSDFKACSALNVNYMKFTGNVATLASSGALLYLDTLGHWGNGCYAANHTHVNVYGDTDVLVHPRGMFTHYYNSVQHKWLSGAKIAATANEPQSWDSTGNGSFSNFFFSEFPSDVNLKYVGGSLLYSPTSVISTNYYSPLALSNQLYSGAPRTDAIFGELDSVNYNLVNIEAKPWNQLNPIFSTVYGDRCILTDWITPWIGNTLNLSGITFKNEASGSVSVYGYPDSQSASHSNRKIQIKNWIAGHLNYFGRISTNIASSQYSSINSEWNNATSTVSGTMDTAHWSGVKNYTKQICRLLAYSPDHMYHGKIEHPLESWTTSNDFTAWTPRTLRVSRLPNASGWQKGDDTVIHGVRRHRDNESILVWMANWCSGSQSFSSTFDPSIYEFSKGYNVYQIGLSDSGNGTFTNLGLYSRTSPYTISVTLEEDSFAALLFDPIRSLTTEQFNNIKTDFTYLRYEYGQQELSQNSVSVSYDYGSQHVVNFNAPQAGYKAPATQSILNNIPQWAKMRQDMTSTGWMLVNSWGQNLEDVLTNVSEAIPNKFLTTSDVKLRSLVNYFDISNEELIDNRVKDNLLFNSSFTIKAPVRQEMPAGWSDYSASSSAISLIDTKSFICPGTIKASGPGKFGQTIYLDNQTVKDLTASIYVLADTYDVNIKVLTNIELLDGRSITKQSAFTSRSTEWRRLVHTVPINSQVYRVQFIVFSECSENVYFSSPKLNIGSSVTKWTDNPSDSLPYVKGSSIFSSVSVIGNHGTNTRKINLFNVASEEEFLSIDIPTRIEKEVLPNPEHLEPFTNNIYGRQVTFFNETVDTQWSISDNKIHLKSYGDTEFNIYRELDIRDLAFSEDGVYGTYTNTKLTLNPLLLCVRGNYLYILCKETYYNIDKYVIKIVRARNPVHGKDYLESLVDFELDLPINSNQFFNEVMEEPITLAFSDVDSTYMVITTNLSRQFYFKMYKDYYYYSPSANRIYCIENYNKSKIQVI